LRLAAHTRVRRPKRGPGRADGLPRLARGGRPRLGQGRPETGTFLVQGPTFCFGVRSTPNQNAGPRAGNVPVSGLPWPSLGLLPGLPRQAFYAARAAFGPP
jgi:hypothetical protein